MHPTLLAPGVASGGALHASECLAHFVLFDQCLNAVNLETDTIERNRGGEPWIDQIFGMRAEFQRAALPLDFEQRLALPVDIHVVVANAEDEARISKHLAQPATHFRKHLQLLHEIVIETTLELPSIRVCFHSFKSPVR